MSAAGKPVAGVVDITGDGLAQRIQRIEFLLFPHLVQKGDIYVPAIQVGIAVQQMDLQYRPDALVHLIIYLVIFY